MGDGRMLDGDWKTRLWRWGGRGGRRWWGALVRLMDWRWGIEEKGEEEEGEEIEEKERSHTGFDVVRGCLRS